MGGFLLIKKNNNSSAEEIEKKHFISIKVFEKKGLKLNRRIANENFIIYVFNKYSLEAENVLQLENGDFVISVGTCIYKRNIGIEALTLIYNDFLNDKSIINNLYGNYGIIIYCNKKLILLNDYLGLYRIFCDKSGNVFSNSFLAVAKSLKEKNISLQEIYEFIFEGAFYGGTTVYKEISFISSDKIHQILPERMTCNKNINYNYSQEGFDFYNEVETISNQLIEYFTLLKDVFNDKITQALSGGFDTRLMLALSRKAGISTHLYVYGDDNCKDVIIAKNITNKEGIKIEHINRDKYPQIKIEKFKKSIENEFYCFDFLGEPIFENGSDFDTRIKRVKNCKLHLNGSGGEIYRNFWELSDKSLSIKNYVKSKFDFFNYSTCTDKFNKKSYFINLEEKIKNVLSIDRNDITRQQAEMIYPLLRAKYWIGKQNSINNQLSYSLTPFLETEFVFGSFKIPMKYKYLGFFEAALIRKIDEKIAKFPSLYGFNFYNSVGIKKKFLNTIKRNTPICIRPFLRRNFRSYNYNTLPYYLSDKYLKEIFDSKELYMNNYIKIKEIKNPHVLSRVLSLELLLSDIL
jgi:hypothetical protein